MSLPVTLSQEAQDDLDAIEDYLALRFSARNAASYVQRIVSACKSIGLAPYRGTESESGPGVRSVGFERRALITFAIEEQAVVILGVFYAGRVPR